MKKIILNIPDNEYGVDIQNKFQDFFGRVKAEIETRVKSGDELVCGTYEIETAKMFLNAFKEMQIIPNNATNGDMIKAMFPNVVNSSLDLVDVFNNAKSWWNSPYEEKRGNENEKE